jgi:hypothetical protein
LLLRRRFSSSTNQPHKSSSSPVPLSCLSYLLTYTGLDSYNAYNVVESLAQLASAYKRTVVFTIHQPQSNIVALFDKLVLLAKGKVVYSGKAEGSQAYFESIGLPCPPGYNIADYLSSSSFFLSRHSSLTLLLAVDVTMQNEKSAASEVTVEDALIQLENDNEIPADRRDPELGSRHARQTSSTSSSADATELGTRNGSKFGSPIKRFFTSGRNSPIETPLPPHLARLVESFTHSDAFIATQQEIANAKIVAAAHPGAGDALVLRNYKQATWWTQFKILSGRSFRNLYRDPMLMLSHYAVAVLAAG